MSEKYQPANSAEGAAFESRFCDRCVRECIEAEEYCEIHTDALMFSCNDPLYPNEWCYGSDGKPTCTAFEEAISVPLQ